MRLTSVKLLQEGEKLGISIFSSEGIPILKAGFTVNDFCIQRLKQMGIKLTYVEDEEIFKDVVYNEPVSMKNRINALQVYHAAREAIAKGKDLNEDAIKEAAKAIVDDVKAVGLPICFINTLYPSDDPLTFHAISTATMAVAMGLQLNYNFSQLCDLSVAAFMHDIGRQSTTDDESPEHVQKGFDALRKCRSISLNSSAVSYQHHENYNGTGLPRGIKGQNISEYSRIVAVVDYFDTLTSGQKGVFLSYEKAYNEILESSEQLFDPEIVKAFKNIIQIYINGTMVVLSDGRQGIICGQNKGFPLRPIVRLFSESIPEYTAEVNLKDNPDLKIQRIIL